MNDEQKAWTENVTYQAWWCWAYMSGAGSKSNRGRTLSTTLV